MKKNILIYIYGNGKGKSTSAIGQAVRIAGNGARVLFVSFFKKGFSSGEKKLLPGIRGIKYIEFFRYQDIKPKTLTDFNAVFYRIQELLTEGKYKAVILDELGVGLYYRLFDKKQTARFVKDLKDKYILIITGRFYVKWLEKMSDISSEILERKHWYHKGILAQKGIEF